MRRGMASLIIGLSLLVATASWAGFTLSRTILDPGRSERLAEQLLDNPQVREALVDRLADAVEPQIPPEVPVSRSLIESGAGLALDDPRVRALVVDGFVRYHQAALEGEAEPVVIDAGALGSASRDALVEVRPELDEFLPATPVVEVELPTAGLTWLATLKRFVDRFTLLGALVAAAGTTLALAVARDRGAVLRRVAFWGYGAAAFWLLIGFAVPRLADLLSPTSGAIASAAVDVFFGAMIRPAVVLAVASTAVLLLGFALPVLGRQRAARVVQPRRPAGPATSPTTRTATATAGVPTGPPPLVSRAANAGAPSAVPDPTMVAPVRPAASAPGTPTPATTVATPADVTTPANLTPPSRTAAASATAPPDRTDEMPRPAPAGSATTRILGDRPDGDPFDDAVTQRIPPAWEEGVGYLDEGDPSDR